MTSSVTSAYTTRVLPPSEWPALGEQDLRVLLPFVRPEETQLVVVEQLVLD